MHGANRDRCDLEKNYFSNQRILITGGSGLVGRGLIKYFLKQKTKEPELEVFSISRNIFSQKNDYPGLNCHYQDLSNNFDYQDLGKFDIIFHCATYGQPQKFIQNKLETIHLNVSATASLFRILSKNGHFGFISSSELYSGLDEEFPSEIQIGTTNPQHPRACYIEAKRTGEAIVHSASNDETNGTNIRLALAYGPGPSLDDKRVLNQFIVSALTKGTIRLLDSGQAVRRYIYIDDAIEMMTKATLWGKESVYNVGGLEPLTILDLAKKIQKLTGCELEVPDERSTNPILGAPQNVGLNINRFTNEFGTPNFTSLDIGLSQTVDYFRKILGIKN